ncbi:hypothetical protein [Desulfobacula phenolica]|uniref:HNH endonuclease n=1 Tax=Desulfobacula phenolica TaxID=90732 RepID=A0A1H2IAA7_9BACT|nr:hypothetical protein [Desulfobacula phenolica]SDU40866.1 hypothetical protein SAMN04487931_10819 [Desulfobacula phenolica]
MLYKIEQVCSNYFNWVRQLQNDLLSKVCAEEVSKNQVSIEYLANQLTEPNEKWFRSLCNRKDKINNPKKTFLQHLQIIADATIDEKKLIFEIFINNQAIEKSFDDLTADAVHLLRKIDEVKNETIQKSYRGFFSIFYDPVFYNGYPVNQEIVFNRKYFVDAFFEDNEIGVCVLCDGSLGDPDVDHFYSKKEFPDLSLHIGNLVPICKTCNSRARKGEKAPLDFAQVEQFLNWYHPYYRSAKGYTVRFENRGQKIFPFLDSDDPTEKTRLQNFNELIGLEDRWRKKLTHIVRTTIKQLKRAQFENLENKLMEMAESKACEIGHLDSGILHAGYLKRAGEGCELLIDELREEFG